MAGMTYGAIGDSWTLSTNFDNVVSTTVNPAVVTGVNSTFDGSMILFTGGKTYTISTPLPYHDINGYTTAVGGEFPSNNRYWADSIHSAPGVYKFYQDAGPLDNVDYKAGDVGGATRVTIQFMVAQAGQYQIDSKAWRARRTDLYGDWEQGVVVSEYLYWSLGGNPWYTDTFIDDIGTHATNGRDNPATLTKTLNLAAGDIVMLDVFRSYGGAWPVGVDLKLTQVPEPATMSVLALGALALIRRRR